MGVFSRTFSKKTSQRLKMISLLIFASALLTVDARVAPPSPLCQYRFDGYTEMGCWGFHRCNNRMLETVTCNGTDVLERDSLSCVPLGTGNTECGVDRSLECSNQADGHYADLRDGCQSYYRCYLHRFIGHFYCPKNTFFRRDQERCDYRANIPANEAALCWPVVG